MVLAAIKYLKAYSVFWFSFQLKHYALGHSKLDELLQDEELVARKREIHQQKPKRLSLGPDCVVCGAKVQTVASHCPLKFRSLNVKNIFV